MFVQRVAAAAIVLTLVVPGQALAQEQGAQGQSAQAQSPPRSIWQVPPPDADVDADDVDDDILPSRVRSKLFWTSVVLMNAGGFVGLSWLGQRYPPAAPSRPATPKSDATLRVATSLVSAGVVCVIVNEVRRHRESRKRASGG